MKTYIDIGINLTNRQFQNDIDNIVQNALDANVVSTAQNNCVQPFEYLFKK